MMRCSSSRKGKLKKIFFNRKTMQFYVPGFARDFSRKRLAPYRLALLLTATIAYAGCAASTPTPTVPPATQIPLDAPLPGFSGTIDCRNLRATHSYGDFRSIAQERIEEAVFPDAEIIGLVTTNFDNSGFIRYYLTFKPGLTIRKDMPRISEIGNRFGAICADSNVIL